VKDLEAKVAELEQLTSKMSEENSRLKHKVAKLESENSRLKGQNVTFTFPVRDTLGSV
jgi:FtsZ-binding cell division protein ZapB